MLRFSVVASVVLCLVSLSGCGGGVRGGGKPVSIPKPSTTTTATQAPKSQAPQPPGGQAKTAASAKAFARFALNRLLYAYHTRDIAPFKAITAQHCDNCGQATDFVNKEVSDKFVQTFAGPPKVHHDEAVSSPNGFDVVLTFENSAGKWVGDDGTVRNSWKGSKNNQFEALLAWTGGAWRVQNFSLNWGKQ